MSHGEKKSFTKKIVDKKKIETTMNIFFHKSKVKFQQKFKASIIAKYIYTLHFIKFWTIVKQSNNRIEKKKICHAKVEIEGGSKRDDHNKINCTIAYYQRNTTIFVIQNRINGKQISSKLGRNVLFKNVITIQVWFDFT